MFTHDLFGWGRPDELERRIRIKLCLWAYAYEITNTPLVDDATFDAMAYSSKPDQWTGRFDEWWRAEFQPDTGLWIHSHPDLAGVARLYTRCR